MNTTQQRPLAEKVALVTGGSRGIGAASARVLEKRKSQRRLKRLEQEKAQETHRKGHQKAGDETQVAQRDAEELSPCLWGLNLLQVLLRIHNWPRKGKCTPLHSARILGYG